MGIEEILARYHALRSKAGEGRRVASPLATSRHRPALGRNEEHPRESTGAAVARKRHRGVHNISPVTRRRRDCSHGDACSAYSGSQIAVSVSKLIGSPNSWITSAPSGLITATKPLFSLAGPAPANTK